MRPLERPWVVVVKVLVPADTFSTDPLLRAMELKMVAVLLELLIQV